MNKFIKYLILTVFMASCSGYRVKKNTNPFNYYGINSINIPLFVNKSIFPKVGSLFTKEIVLVLEGHKGLKVSGGSSKNSDAVLIGVLESENLLRDAKKTSSSISTSGDLDNYIGKRPNFYIPADTDVRLKLRLVLIKNPSEEEIKLLTNIYPAKFHSPKIIFDERFDLATSISRIAAGANNPDEAGVVNQTKNLGLLNKALISMSKQSANQFRELILNAF